MPIIWRYLLRHYLKVLGFSVLTFLIVLFVSRLRQLAQFALLGSGLGEIGRFALFLIPYVLPIALPIGCLIGAMILFAQLCANGELVALRAGGLGLHHILTPVLLTALALTLTNFYIASELATHCHLLGIKMKSDKSTLNPLVALQNTDLLALGEAFVDMRTTKVGEEAENLTLAFLNTATGRLNLLMAGRIYQEAGSLHGDRLSILAPFPLDEGFDALLVENQEHMWIDSQALTGLLSTASWRPKNHYLRLRLLLMRLSQNRARLRQPDAPRALLIRRISTGYSEITRRLSLALAVLTFTILGCAFGINPARTPSRVHTLQVASLAVIFIGCFLAAGQLGELLPVAVCLYLLPHMLMTAVSARRLWQVSKGILA